MSYRNEPAPRPWLVRLGHVAEGEVDRIAAFDGRSRNWVIRALVEDSLHLDTERARLVRSAQERMGLGHRVA